MFNYVQQQNPASCLQMQVVCIGGVWEEYKGLEGRLVVLNICSFIESHVIESLHHSICSSFEDGMCGVIQ